MSGLNSTELDAKTKEIAACRTVSNCEQGATARYDKLTSERTETVLTSINTMRAYDQCSAGDSACAASSLVQMQRLLADMRVRGITADTQSGQSVATLTSRDLETANGALTNTLTLQQAQALQATQHKAKENAQAAQLLGSVMDGVIGDVGVKYGWAEGGPEKTALHGLSGLIQAKVAGSNGLAGLAAGAANEVLLPVISNYLVAQGYTPGTAEFNSLLTAGSTLVGAAVGAAAGSAGMGVQFETKAGNTGMTINQLIEKGYLEVAKK